MKIQILLSTYNGEKYLREQLESFRKMEQYESTKVLIRDDGSSDHTPDILREYADKYGYEIMLGPNLGVNKSFFELFRASDKSCSFYAISDQDDVWLPNKFALAIQALESQQQNQPLLFASISKIVSKDLSPLGETMFPKRGVGFYNAMVQNVLPGHTQVFNRTLLLELLRGDAMGIHVIDWWIYLIASGLGIILFEPTATVLHRQHGGNAVGYETQWFPLLKQRIHRLKCGKSTLVSCQLASFGQRYAADLPESYKKAISSYFVGQTGWYRRVWYILSTPVYRQTAVETIIFKMMYLLGKYDIDLEGFS